ncbi:MAG: hypothetical protein LBG27_03225 [Spirochaetaceae bacterium]|jgi:hypothetical protein|nr:hypothetical protein [Spirochaetaceae bacterium]
MAAAMKPDIKGQTIARGYNCFVRVSKTADATSPSNTIGYVTSFQATEDFSVQEAVCLGNLGPIAIDPQGYTCNIQIGAFIPAVKTSLTNAPEAGTAMSATPLESDIPSRADFMDDTNAAVERYSYLDFYDKKNGRIVAKFTGVLVTSNGVQSEGNAYVRHNVSMRALSWDKD